MKAKRAIKIGVDIAMTVLFLCQMGYHMMDNRAHEWLGVALCLMFILHHALNGGWHMPATMWAFVLTGLHWSMALRAVRKKIRRKTGKAAGCGERGAAWLETRSNETGIVF